MNGIIDALRPPYKNVGVGYSVHERLMYEWNNRRAHCMAGPPYNNVGVGYSIHTFIKQPKSIFYSYN